MGVQSVVINAQACIYDFGFMTMLLLITTMPFFIIPGKI